MSRILAPLALAAAVAVADPSTAPTFPTPEAATDALAGSLARRDVAALRALLGPEHERLVPLDDVSEPDREEFLAEWARGHRVERDGATARLVLGDGWTLPVPLVRRGEGWAFDTLAGVEEVRVRRIGRNELAAIQALFAILDAQVEYAGQDRDGDGVLEYARRFASGPGVRDGLSWPAAEGEPESPAGPLLDTGEEGDGYYGYRFRILEAQGPAAPGGARAYRSGDNLVRGFAVVAWPARYGETGVKSFLVSHEGEAFEKDLGSESAAVAGAMERFDPVPTWTRLPPS